MAKSLNEEPDRQLCCYRDKRLHLRIENFKSQPSLISLISLQEPSRKVPMLWYIRMLEKRVVAEKWAGQH